MIVFAELILELKDRLTRPHRAPLEMPGCIRYPHCLLTLIVLQRSLKMKPRFTSHEDR